MQEPSSGILPSPEMNNRSRSQIGENSLAGSSSGKKTKTRDPAILGAGSDRTRNMSRVDGQDNSPTEIPYNHVKPAYKVIIIESTAPEMTFPGPGNMHQQVLGM